MLRCKFYFLIEPFKRMKCVDSEEFISKFKNKNKKTVDNDEKKKFE